jgi:hypothetical protein
MVGGSYVEDHPLEGTPPCSTLCTPHVCCIQQQMAYPAPETHTTPVSDVVGWQGRAHLQYHSAHTRCVCWGGGGVVGFVLHSASGWSLACTPWLTWCVCSLRTRSFGPPVFGVLVSLCVGLVPTHFGMVQCSVVAPEGAVQSGTGREGVWRWYIQLGGLVGGWVLTHPPTPMCGCLHAKSSPCGGWWWRRQGNARQQHTAAAHKACVWVRVHFQRVGWVGVGGLADLQ